MQTYEIISVKTLLILGILLTFSCSRNSSEKENYSIRKNNVTYDFTFAELSVRYLETGDSSILYSIARTAAARHILAHAIRFNNNVPKGSALQLVKYLLTPIAVRRILLHQFKRNLIYARDSIASVDLPQKECLKSLPEGFHYSASTHLFFTFGYDLGVTINGNSSVNLANQHYLGNMHELRYYSIHELHHAGFIQIKKNQMPSLSIRTFKEMATLIEYLTQLEGMGTFAPLELREKEHAMNADNDYIALQDTALMSTYTKEYFSIYHYFKDHPENILKEDDWDKINILSDKKRLWYRVGAQMASEIKTKSGINTLTRLMTRPPEGFIECYLTTTIP